MYSRSCNTCSFLVLLTVACTDEENSVRALKAHGFASIRTIGYTLFECGKDDTFHTGFVARFGSDFISRVMVDFDVPLDQP